MKKNIFYMILGGILFTTVSVLAYNLSSNEVFYKKVNNEDKSVQQALDDLYTKVKEDLPSAQSSCPTGMICAEYGTPQYYAWNETPSSSTSAGEHNVYVTKWSDVQKGVCINRNGTEYCFRANNWFAEREHVQQVFSGENDNCGVISSSVGCNDSDFYCNVYSNGAVDCYDSGSGEICSVYGDGTVDCG